MKQTISSKFCAWFNSDFGLSYTKILRYFYPEFITGLIVYFLPQFIDCQFICYLKSTNLYAISGIVENFLTMFTKSAEGFLIGTVVIAGYFNGKGDYKRAGASFIDSFWTTIFIGFFVSIALYYGVHCFYQFNSFTPEMIEIGTPFLRLKSIGVFFMYFYFALVGFFRSVKNTFTPMVVFAIGSCTFLLCDYLFIFGKFGFPELGLLGSAVAFVVQYMTMSFLMLMYLMYERKYATYELSFFKPSITTQGVKKFLCVALPVVLDKISISFAYVWLASCISELGSVASASYGMIKMMERIAFLPAISFSQIITFLVSNDLGAGRVEDILGNLKKVIVLSIIMVGSILLLGVLYPSILVDFYGCSPEICYLVTAVFPPLSILVMFDLLQLILSGTLRGAGQVQTVMITRVCVIVGYFVPVTYLIAYMSLETIAMKMLVTYAAFLFGNGLMNVVYIIRLRQLDWKKETIKVVHE